MNWGKSIIVVFVLFVLMMMYFLVRTLMAGDEGVPDHYYEKGNQHQKVLDEETRAQDYKPRIEYDKSNQVFIVIFENHKNPDSMSLFFKWPPDEKKNIRVNYGELRKDEYYSAYCKGPKGGWNAEAEYYLNGKKYLHKQKVWVE